MKKKKIIRVTLIMLLIISLTSNMYMIYNKSKLKRNLETSFRYHLATAFFSFGFDFQNVEADENLKSYYYSKAMAHTAAASELAQHLETKGNDQLSSSLNRLFLLMQDQAYKEKIIENHYEIYDILEQISRDSENDKLKAKLFNLVYKQLEN